MIFPYDVSFWLSTLKIFILIAVRFVEKITEVHSDRFILQYIRGVVPCHNERQVANRLHFLLLVVAMVIFNLAFLLSP